MKADAITQCRLCRSAQLNMLLDLGMLASCGMFPAANEPDPPSAPLSLVQCADCGLVQLRHDFSGEDLFRHTYGYRSGLNDSMVRHLGGIVAAASAAVGLQTGDLVLDIGSNDGTLLSHYPANAKRIGIDPTSARFAHHYPQGAVISDDFFNAGTFQKLAGGAKAKIVTSISMFYDLPDPNAFVADVQSILAQEGVWILEQSYLPMMVEKNSFDTICHEHLEYYGLSQIERLLNAHGLRAFDVRMNEVNGGSFQVWTCHSAAAFSANEAALQALRRKEGLEHYASGVPIRDMAGRVLQVRENVLKFLRSAKANGKLVHGYGASTKGNTTLQYFGITPICCPRSPSGMKRSSAAARRGQIFQSFQSASCVL